MIPFLIGQKILMIIFIFVPWATNTDLREDLYARTMNLSISHWNDAEFVIVQVSQSLVECASMCHQSQEFSTQQCNAFSYSSDSMECNLASLTFLEDIQPGIENQVFHTRLSMMSSLNLQCYGGEHCCRPENMCVVNEGDCNTEADCDGWGFVCGINNCLELGESNRVGGLWDQQDDCCERRCTPEHPCPRGHGHCESDSDCATPTLNKCEASGCLDSAYFPVADYPNNTATFFKATDSCCRKRCYPHQKCGNNVAGCENDDDCQSGFACSENGICIDIDECADGGVGITDCGSNAICTNSPGSYSCSCPTGYDNFVSNVGCSDIDECSLNTHPKCKDNTDCINSPGNYECSCLAGFTGDPYSGCIDINECSEGLDACQDNTNCENEIGSYDCHCNSGFEGDPFAGCTDIDNCAKAELHPDCKGNAKSSQSSTMLIYKDFHIIDNSFCTNTIGDYYCTCNDGFEGVPAAGCTDIDNCKDAALYPDCKDNSHCVNTFGGYDCNCDSGYGGVPKDGCTDINECLTGVHTCQDNAHCNNTIGSFDCYCNFCYEGDPYVGCTLDPDPCACVICPDANSYCSPTVIVNPCTCNSGYEGDPYSTGCNDIDECSLDIYCNENAACTNLPGSYTCSCEAGYQGDPYSGKSLNFVPIFDFFMR